MSLKALLASKMDDKTSTALVDFDEADLPAGLLDAGIRSDLRLDAPTASVPGSLALEK